MSRGDGDFISSTPNYRGGAICEAIAFTCILGTYGAFGSLTRKRRLHHVVLLAVGGLVAWAAGGSTGWGAIAGLASVARDRRVGVARAVGEAPRRSVSASARGPVVGGAAVARRPALGSGNRSRRSDRGRRVRHRLVGHGIPRRREASPPRRDEGSRARSRGRRRGARGVRRCARGSGVDLEASGTGPRNALRPGGADRSRSSSPATGIRRPSTSSAWAQRLPLRSGAITAICSLRERSASLRLSLLAVGAFGSSLLVSPTARGARGTRDRLRRRVETQYPTVTR